tara:strand:- start:325 stop:447 length:123 start_codon:yes stop_codon:yes gene_type:complete
VAQGAGEPAHFLDASKEVGSALAGQGSAELRAEATYVASE